MGNGRAEGSSAIGEEGQSAISLMPDIDGTGSSSFNSGFNSIYPSGKAIQKCLDSSSLLLLFFLIIDDMVALYCRILKCCAIFVYRSAFRSCSSKNNIASSDKKIALAISCIMNPFGSSITSSSSCLSSFFLFLNSIRSSSLVSSSYCTARSSRKPSSCSSSSSFSLRVTKLLKTFFQGNGCNLMLSKVNRFYGLVDIIRSDQISHSVVSDSL